MAANTIRDKYCLKGKYFETYQKINNKLMWYLPRKFKQKILNNIINKLYTYQSNDKNISEISNDKINAYVNNTIESYYGTSINKKVLQYILKNSLLLMILIITINIFDNNIFTIFMGIFAFVVGFISSIYLYKSKSKPASAHIWILDIVIFITLALGILKDTTFKGSTIEHIFDLSISPIITIVLFTCTLLLYLLLVYTSNKTMK